MATTFQQTATLFIIGAILSLTQGQNIDPEIQEKIDDYIQNFYLPATQTSTLGLSIVQNDGEVLSFTSVIVIKVLSEKFPELGEKVLDTPIRKLIPSANFTLNDRFRSEHTTFRDLLAHRTCISSNDLPLMTDAFDSAEDLTYRVRYTEEVCGIRSEFQYNNQMFVVAGHLAGLIANRSYEDLMQDLLTDLGMLNSSLTKLSDDFSNMPYRAMPRVIPFNAAGGLYATPDDMTRYMRFHLNFGSLDGKQVLPEAVMRWMTKPAIVAPWFAFKSSEEEKVTILPGIWMGLFLGQHGGWQYVYHGGFWGPYLTRMSLFPKKKWPFLQAQTKAQLR
ncbi:Gigasin-6 [Orchesella cincta]|uniref:Gigasin-6 n=1 Tax=Orchesella cincta TaxID=48709 RepID=A0A1D2MDW8_ORCCI|nr:Gigasin-6 [Orchesella cincta]